MNKLEKAKVIVEIIAVILAGLWAVWVFCFKEIYPRYVALPQLVIDVKTEPVAFRDSLSVLQTTLHLSNKSAYPVYVARLWAITSGEVVSRNPSRKYDTNSLNFNSFLNGKDGWGILRKHVISQEREQIGVSDILGAWARFEPNEEMTFRFVDYVPKRDGLIEIHTRAFVAKDTGGIDFKWVVDSTGSYCGELEGRDICPKIYLKRENKMVDYDSLSDADFEILKSKNNWIYTDSYIETSN